MYICTQTYSRSIALADSSGGRNALGCLAVPFLSLRPISKRDSILVCAFSRAKRTLPLVYMYHLFQQQLSNFATAEAAEATAGNRYVLPFQCSSNIQESGFLPGTPDPGARLRGVETYSNRRDRARETSRSRDIYTYAWFIV